VPRARVKLSRARGARYCGTAARSLRTLACPIAASRDRQQRVKSSGCHEASARRSTACLDPDNSNKRTPIKSACSARVFAPLIGIAALLLGSLWPHADNILCALSGLEPELGTAVRTAAKPIAESLGRFA
jgi:hypothetical protein